LNPHDRAERGEQKDDWEDDAPLAGLHRRSSGATLLDLFDVLLECCCHDLNP
jgi:hypothetical protein